MSAIPTDKYYKYLNTKFKICTHDRHSCKCQSRQQTHVNMYNTVSVQVLFHNEHIQHLHVISSRLVCDADNIGTLFDVRIEENG